MAKQRKAQVGFGKLFFIGFAVITTAVVLLFLKQQQNSRSSAAESFLTTSLRAKPAYVAPGGEVTTIFYTKVPTNNDWIGLFKQTSTVPLAKQSIRDCQFTIIRSAIAGNCRFTMPTILGMYEFRFYRYTAQIAISNVVTVTTSIPTTSSFPTRYPTYSPSGYPTISPILSCYPPPPCLTSVPQCEIPEPIGGWCPVQ